MQLGSANSNYGHRIGSNGSSAQGGRINTSYRNNSTAASNSGARVGQSNTSSNQSNRVGAYTSSSTQGARIGSLNSSQSSNRVGNYYSSQNNRVSITSASSKPRVTSTNSSVFTCYTCK